MQEPRIVAFVMAGGEGLRLRPFTQELPKPALPFAGGYRIIDFVLSNLHNSMIRSIFVLLKYKPRPLMMYLAEGWAFANKGGGEFIAPALPQDIDGGGGFKGTADAVYRSLDLLEGYCPDVVAVFSADHVYRMDVRQMAAFHEASGADATVAAVPVPVDLASCFGIVVSDSESRITGFREKPAVPEPMPGDPGRAFASMGNYLFRPAVLREALLAAARRGEHDFGQHILPRLINTHRVFAYDFAKNVVPGVRDYEERNYWRDIGTVEAYAAAHWDMLGPQPRFCLDSTEWPIYSENRPRFVRAISGDGVSESILGPGSRAHGASLRRSILQRGVLVEAGASVENCIIMDGVTIHRGARLKRAIVGPGNTLGPATRIGFDQRLDSQRYTVTPGGFIVVPPKSACGPFPAHAPEGHPGPRHSTREAWHDQA